LETHEGIAAIKVAINAIPNDQIANFLPDGFMEFTSASVVCRWNSFVGRVLRLCFG
jgi:hypothetical protein